MYLANWTNRRGDPIRRRRLAFGYALGTLGAGAFVAFLALTTKAEAVEKEEEVHNVQLAKEPEPEPEPEEAPPPDPDPAPRKAGPRMPKLTQPTEIPDDKPAETEPTNDSYGEGDPYARAGGGGTAVKGPVAPPPEPPKEIVKPKPVRKIYRITEVTTPPKEISKPPCRPSAASTLEGTLVIKYIIDESGKVSAAKILKGPQEFSECEAVVRGWTFEPARNAEGQAVAVTKIQKFVFTLKN
jgi:periplasmic protein TonB